MTEDLVNTDISTEELLGIEQPNVSEVEGETTQAINADHGGDEDALLPREGSPVEESSVPKRKRRRRSRKSAAFQAFEVRFVFEHGVTRLHSQSKNGMKNLRTDALQHGRLFQLF